MIELDNVTKDLAENAAKLIKQLNSQEVVLLQEIPVVSQFITVKSKVDGDLSAANAILNKIKSGWKL
jgi:hypothetical protein